MQIQGKQCECIKELQSQQLYQSLYPQLRTEMGCAGSIDDTTLYHTATPYKTSQLKNPSSSPKQKSKEQPGPEVRTIKMCSANLSKTLSPFEFFVINAKEQGKQPEQEQLNAVYERISAWYEKMREVNQVEYIEENGRDESYIRHQQAKEQEEQQIKSMAEFHHITINRYTPLKNPGVGNKNQLILMNTEEFYEKWDEVFDELLKKLRINVPAEIRRRLRQFDLICYHSLVSYFYEHSSNKIANNNNNNQGLGHETQKNIKGLVMHLKIAEPKDHLQQLANKNYAFGYLNFIIQKFSSPVNNEEQKIVKFISFIQRNKFDIIFLQEVSSRSLELFRPRLQGYRIVNTRRSSTAIFIRTQLSVQLQQKQRNLTLNGHNARYVDSKVIAQIKNSQLSKTNANFSHHQNEKNTFYDSLALIYHKNKELIIKKETRQVTPQAKEQEKDKSILNKIEEVPEEGPSWQKQFITELTRKTAQLLNPKQGRKSKKLKAKQARNQQTPRKPSSPPSKKLSKIKSYHPEKSDQKQQQSLNIGFQLIAKTNSILLKQQGKYKQQHLAELRSKFQSVYQFLGCLILVSAKCRTREQMWELKNRMEDMGRKFPYHTIVVGLHGQQSRKIYKNKIKDQMEIFRNYQDTQAPIISFCPDIYDAVPGLYAQQKCSIQNRKLRKLVQKKSLLTKQNKKTSFQPNPQDRNQEYLGVNSFILTNKSIKDFSIRTCSNNIINDSRSEKRKRFIPSQDHPFPDYFVCADVEIDVRQVLEYRGGYHYDDDQEEQQQNT